jgi:hypothetical protein
MSLAVAALRAAGPVEIRDVANVATSFPGFVATARSVGVTIGQANGPATGSEPISGNASATASAGKLQKRSSELISAPVPVVTIDGPGGSGKGTVGRRVATRLGWHLLDSGALYRLVALKARMAGIPLTDEARLATAAAALDVDFAGGRTLLEGVDVTETMSPPTPTWPAGSMCSSRPTPRARRRCCLAAGT